MIGPTNGIWYQARCDPIIALLLWRWTSSGVMRMQRNRPGVSGACSVAANHSALV
eukprot:COSAG01_NODE_11455_length_1930_cov_1.682141_2_plen_55_part_00